MIAKIKVTEQIDIVENSIGNYYHLIKAVVGKNEEFVSYTSESKEVIFYRGESYNVEISNYMDIKKII